MTTSLVTCEPRPSWACAKPESASTTPSRRYGLDADYHLRNWARWCKDKSGIYPHCPTNWEQFEQVEYKNCHLTTDEKLEEILRSQPIDERMAERTELWIGQFDNVLHREALRTYWVEMPESQRLEWHVDEDTWLARRAVWTAKRLRELGSARKVTVDDYEAAVNEATRQVTECILIWARGA